MNFDFSNYSLLGLAEILYDYCCNDDTRCYDCPFNCGLPNGKCAIGYPSFSWHEREIKKMEK